MSYLVTVAFDLHEVSEKDWERVYKDVYASLSKLGLSHTADGKNKVVTLPESTVIGDFEGDSAADVRDDVRKKVAGAFKAKQLKSSIFVTVGEDGTWGSTTT